MLSRLSDFDLFSILVIFAMPLMYFTGVSAVINSAILINERYFILMTRPCLFFILFLTACTGNPAFGQIGEAKKQMALYNYSEALPVLNKILQKDGKDKKEAALLMAVCFLKQNDVLNARLWFAKAIEYGNNEPSTLFSYAQVLRSCGDYLKAKECFQKYAGISPNDSRAGILANNCDSAIAWKDIPAGYEVKNALSLNSEQSEFGPVFYGNSLCFTSDRLASDNKHDTYGWTGNAYLHLYFADPVYPGDTYNDYREIRPAPDLFNKDYHDGPATFNDSLTEVFFTRTLQYMDKGKKAKGTYQDPSSQDLLIRKKRIKMG